MSETNDEPGGLDGYRRLQMQYYRKYREITDELKRRSRLAGVGVNFGLSSWSGEDLEWRAEMLFALNELATSIPGFNGKERKRIDDEVWKLVDDELA